MEYGVNGLAPTDIIRQSVIIHPDWDSEMHLSYLINDEFVDEDIAVGAVAWAVMNGLTPR